MVKTPVTPSIEKNAASAPPVIEYVAAKLSASAEVTVVTAVVFSATFIAAVSPPSLDVITGVMSFVLVIVTVIV